MHWSYVFLALCHRFDLCLLHVFSSCCQATTRTSTSVHAPSSTPPEADVSQAPIVLLALQRHLTVTLGITVKITSCHHPQVWHVHGLMQKKHNSSVLTMQKWDKASHTMIACPRGNIFIENWPYMIRFNLKILGQCQNRPTSMSDGCLYNKEQDLGLCCVEN